MKFEVIKTEQEYTEALERLEKVFDAKIGTAEGDDLEALSLSIENYEKEYFPI